MAVPATATTQLTATGSVADQRMRAISQKGYGTADVLRVAEIKAAGDRSRRGAGEGFCLRGAPGI